MPVNNPFLNPPTGEPVLDRYGRVVGGGSGVVTGTRSTPWNETPNSNYTVPMHRGPGTPPHSNFRNPYAPRELLPYYVGFPSEYPHILPTETQDPYALAYAMVRPWLLPRRAPVARPAPARAAGGGGPAKQQPKTPATPPETPPSKNTQTPITPNRYMGLNGVSGTGFDPFNRGGTAPELRHDPDLTMQTPQSQIGTPGGGAIVLDALNDMLNRHLETGQPAAQASPLAPMPTLRPGMTPGQLANDNTGIGATRYAESQGLDRSGYWRTMQELQRMSRDAKYADLLRQQRGF